MSREVGSKLAADQPAPRRLRIEPCPRGSPVRLKFHSWSRRGIREGTPSILRAHPVPWKGVPKACQETFILVHFQGIYLHIARRRASDSMIGKSLIQSDLRVVAGDLNPRPSGMSLIFSLGQHINCPKIGNLQRPLVSG
jgi:hypothetical protein